MVKLGHVILGHDVLAIRLPQFGKPADLMNDYSALLTLQDIGEPSIGELAAEIAEVEGLLFRALPFVFG